MDSSAQPEASITFSVTTCRRLELFFRMMDSFLSHCVDRELIGRWICVDDNSSEADREAITERYPWLELIRHDADQRGHHHSIARIWELCETELLFATEDDWEFCERISLAALREKLETAEVDQVIISSFSPAWDWDFNPRHAKLSEGCAAIARDLGLETEPKETTGWCWPGFSLNPSMVRLGHARRLVPEVPAGEHFEFELSLRLHLQGFRALRLHSAIVHRGEVAAYVLNAASRDHDQKELVSTMSRCCVSEPRRAIELSQYLDHALLTPSQSVDALHALAAAQWYVDRRAGQKTLAQLWQRGRTSGLLFDKRMAALLGYYDSTWERIIGYAEPASFNALDPEEALALPLAPAERAARREQRVPLGDSLHPTTIPGPRSDAEITLAIEGERLASLKCALSSFCACCTDLDQLVRWVCVFDGSAEDHAELQRCFPWIELAPVEHAPRGIARRQQLLRDLVQTPYVFQLDASQVFFFQSSYLTRCRLGLSVSPSVGQCLVNINYADGPDGYALTGGMPFQHEGQAFVAHIFDPEGDAQDVCHWPHYSLRPALLRREAWALQVPSVPFFELQLARRYTKAGWLSIFLPDIYHQYLFSEKEAQILSALSTQL